MVKNIKENFKNSYSDLTCDTCETGSIESQSHAVMCPGWEDQWQGLELTNIKDFNRILKEKGNKEGYCLGGNGYIGDFWRQ